MNKKYIRNVPTNVQVVVICYVSLLTKVKDHVARTSSVHKRTISLSNDVIYQFKRDYQLKGSQFHITHGTQFVSLEIRQQDLRELSSKILNR